MNGKTIEDRVGELEKLCEGLRRDHKGCKEMQDRENANTRSGVEKVDKAIGKLSDRVWAILIAVIIQLLAAIIGFGLIYAKTIIK